MKKMLIAAAAVFSLTGAAYAGGSEPPPPPSSGCNTCGQFATSTSEGYGAAIGVQGAYSRGESGDEGGGYFGYGNGISLAQGVGIGSNGGSLGAGAALAGGQAGAIAYGNGPEQNSSSLTITGGISSAFGKGESTAIRSPF